MVREVDANHIRPTVLIVDDEIDITTSLARSLRDQFKVLTANSSAEALEILKQNDVAVILTDQRMPESSGVALLEASKQIRPDTLGVIITGYSDITVLIDAINIGTARGYIPKPWNLDKLRQTLNQVARQYQAIITDREILSSTAESIVNVRKEIEELRLILEQMAIGQLDMIFQSSGESADIQFIDGHFDFSINSKYFENLSDGIAVLNHNGILEYANPSFINFFELNQSQTLYLTPLQEAPQIQSYAPLINTLDVVLRGEYILADCSIQNSQGELRYIEITATPVPEENEQFKAVLVARDQTARQQAIYHLTCLNAVANAISQMAEIKDALPNALEFVCDTLKTDGYITFSFNPFSHAFIPVYAKGISKEGFQFITQNPISVEDDLIKPALNSQQAMMVHLNKNDSSPFAVWTRGEQAVSLGLIPIQVSENLIGLLVIFSRNIRIFSKADMTVLTTIGSQIGLGLRNATLHEVVLAQAQTDVLTGIMNRRHFMEVLTFEYERSLVLQTPLTLLMLDLDKFKEVNDHYGHMVGDEVLKRVSKKLSASTRPDDYVARYGGDEFIILLTKTDFETGQSIAHRIERAISGIELPVQNVHNTVLGISIGVASLKQTPPESLDNLISRADSFLYQAKAKKEISN